MKVKKQAVPMREQPAGERIGNFREVPLGYSESEAISEAGRCLQCRNRPCVKGCPVAIDIPGFIRAVHEGQFRRGMEILHRNDSLPAITGRVCPQEDQCQCKCVVGRVGEPVAIGALERFLADWARRESPPAAAPAVASGPAVAVVGSGPAGLTCAAELARKGCAVTVLEGFHEPGGVMVYGIPEFRLPKAIVADEVAYLRSLGVRFQVNTLVGRAVTIGELLAEHGFRAVFIGAGAGLPQFMRIPGENLAGIYSANEYLTRVNLMKAYRFPEYDTPVKRGRRVAVIGAGNVAMDAARTAVRLGAEKVLLLYRRTEQEMPARREEIVRAREEGVEFHLLTAPTAYRGDAQGFVTAARCLRMELGEPDDSGRRRPVPLPGSDFTVALDQVIVAIGNTPNPIIARTTPNLKTTRWGTIVADEDGRTSLPGVYAGGDIVTGAATVITAMGAGRRAAAAIAAELGVAPEPGAK